MKTKLLAAFLVVLAFPVVGLADWTVSPSGTYDFGDVEVGTPSSVIFTLTNLSDLDLDILVVEMYGQDPSEFSVTEAPDVPFIVDGLGSIDIEVTYTPVNVGASVDDYLFIYADDPSHDSEFVPLSGEGVESEPPPDEQIQDILDFIDDSVEAGDLSGSGPGNSANGRLNALINMVEAAGDLIEDGDYEGAYDQLETVYRKCDGEAPPPDFVEGDAREELAGMISDLMAVLLASI